MLKLGVNIDHVATVREARYRGQTQGEPCPVEAVRMAETAGAHGITAHLREDRRHIQDRDIWAIREAVTTRLNFEMANTAEMIDIATRLKPEAVCLVPENRAEVTTEGGLNVAGQIDAITATAQALGQAGIEVSLFIDPDPEQIEATAEQAARSSSCTLGRSPRRMPTKPGALRKSSAWPRPPNRPRRLASVSMPVTASTTKTSVQCLPCRTSTS